MQHSRGQTNHGLLPFPERSTRLTHKPPYLNDLRCPRRRRVHVMQQRQVA
jgi:hypothetical protein